MFSKEFISPFVRSSKIPLIEKIIAIIFFILTLSLKKITPKIYTIIGVLLDIIDILIEDIKEIPLKNKTPFNTIPKKERIKMYNTSFFSIENSFSLKK